jgi:hypothetical protein
MEYTPELGQPFIGKRVIVSLREIDVDGEETLTGFYGVIESAHEGGLVLRVEGQGDDKYWVMPPDLDALMPAEAEAYQLERSDGVVTDVDYVARFVSAGSVEDLSHEGGDVEELKS